jgi:hypothetical protein
VTTPLNHTVFNAYVKYMRKTARAYNLSQRFMRTNARRHSYWAHRYLKYAKRAVKLAWQMPQEHRINFERFLAYDKTRNMLAFTGTLQQAKDLCK